MNSATIGQATHSSRILIRMGVVILALIAIVAWQLDYLVSLYLENQVTKVGWFINGAVGTLFLSGLIRLIHLFVNYHKEEQALNDFVRLIRTKDTNHPASSIPPDSIIGQRFKTIEEFYKARTEINHNALAATLLAEQSSRTSYPKFVNNVLILTGVFGTIVSLTVALLGASTAISDTQSVAGLNVVIHGMSTALSTTMSAIAAYFVFAYFYLKLLDTQSYILGRVEHLSATELIPRYQVSTHAPEQNLSNLLAGLSETMMQFQSTVKNIDAVNQQQGDTYERMHFLLDENRRLLDDISKILRTGFRLRERKEDPNS